MPSSLRSKSSQYSSVSSTRRTNGGDALPSVAGMPASRRSRRSAAMPSRSIGYFAVPPPPRSGRPRSARYGTLSSNASSVSASRSSVDLARQHSNPSPSLTPPCLDTEPVTEPEPEPVKHRAPYIPSPPCEPCAPCAPPVAVLGQPRCAVEADLFRLGDTVARLPCGHVFHRDCILPFLSHSRDGGYCPIDGIPVPSKDASLLNVWRVSLADSRPPEVPDSTDATSDAPSFARTGTRESDASARKWAPQFRETCAIDGARFRQGELCVRFASCGHVFHARCVRAYLARDPTPRCPLDGDFILESDIKHVVVAGPLERAGFNTRPAKRTPQRIKDSRVRRSLRVLARANDSLRDVAALEIDSDSRVRMQCVHERAESIGRRRFALGDTPESCINESACGETCAVDFKRLMLNERVVALECGHALHADCAATGAACGCAGAASGERRTGRFFEMLPALADTAAMRWRCAELATHARECTAARALDAVGEPKKAAALAEAAAAELRFSMRARRTALALAPHAPAQRSIIATNFRRGEARRLSLPEKRLCVPPSMQGSSKSAPHLDDLSERISAGLSGLKQGRGAPRRASFLNATVMDIRETAVGDVEPPRTVSEVGMSAIVRHLSMRNRRSRRRGSRGSADSASFDSRVSADSAKIVKAMNRRVSAECEHGNGEACVIDARPFRKGDHLVRLPCMHIFHRDCILPYLRQCDRPACPVDLTLIPLDAVDDLPAWIYAE